MPSSAGRREPRRARPGSVTDRPGYRLAIHRTASCAVTVADGSAAQRREHGAGPAETMERRPWDDGDTKRAEPPPERTGIAATAAAQPLPSGGRGDSLSLGGRAGYGGQRGGDRPGARVPPTARRQDHAARRRSLHVGRGDHRHGGAGGAGLGGLAHVRPGTAGRSRSPRTGLIALPTALSVGHPRTPGRDRAADRSSRRSDQRGRRAREDRASSRSRPRDSGMASACRAHAGSPRAYTRGDVLHCEPLGKWPRAAQQPRLEGTRAGRGGTRNSARGLRLGIAGVGTCAPSPSSDRAQLLERRAPGVKAANPSPTSQLPWGLRRAGTPPPRGALGAHLPTGDRTPPSCRCPRHRGWG